MEKIFLKICTTFYDTHKKYFDILTNFKCHQKSKNLRVPFKAHCFLHSYGWTRAHDTAKRDCRHQELKLELVTFSFRA